MYLLDIQMSSNVLVLMWTLSKKNISSEGSQETVEKREPQTDWYILSRFRPHTAENMERITSSLSQTSLFIKLRERGLLSGKINDNIKVINAPWYKHAHGLHESYT